jgi:predicted pyridoxine 5'-phosphate oxidase superfamily flavin-nucleotide-binding protein
MHVVETATLPGRPSLDVIPAIQKESIQEGTAIDGDRTLEFPSRDGTLEVPDVA